MKGEQIMANELKAIGFLKNLKLTANEDSDGDTFFCKEYDFFKTIDEMITELEKDEIQYICGFCFTPQTKNLPCNESGNCSECEEDLWIERIDVFPKVKPWVKKLCKKRDVSIELIKLAFN